MFRTRAPLAAGVLALMAALGNSQPGAQPARGTPAPLVAALVPYLGDESLQNDLKLTPEQARKLLDHRQKLWDEAYTRTSREFAAKASRRPWRYTICPTTRPSNTMLPTRILM